MEHYKNLGGNSGVVGYEIGADYIRVQFSNDSVYLYTYTSAGRSNIEKMKELAVKGIGLNSYIDNFVHRLYSRKEK